jgi:predicted aspartyl protease
MKSQSRFLSLLVTTIVATAMAPASRGQEHEPEPGQFEFSGHSIAVPFMNEHGHPKVNIDLGDGKPHAMVVDTGSSVNVIDIGIAESFAYEVIGETEIGAPGGLQIPAKIVQVPLARLGDGKIIDAEFVTMDSVGFTGGAMLGVIGMGLFRDYLLTFDYGQNEIRLSRDSLQVGDVGVMPYDFADSLVTIDIDVAGVTVKSHIDTGSMGGFTLPVEIRDSLPLANVEQPAVTARVVGGDRNIQFAQLDGNILFAGKTYENPQLAFIEPSTGFGNIGSRVLSEYVMSVDQANRLIRFGKAALPPVAMTGNTPRRLGVQFSGIPGGKVLTVARVDPGSLAESSGLLPGDVLVKLNNKPTAEYDMTSLGTLFRGAEPLRLDIDRDGRMLTIEIP